MPDDADRCSSCGQSLGDARPAAQPADEAPSEPVPTYLVWAILTTLFCCLPFGIVSIVYAAQVNGKAAQGDYTGAREASAKAKMWGRIAFYCGLVPIVLYILAAVLIPALSR
ncbi:MAG: CD225/dispanin family protein [Planctomycetes bacterium]|nr:CD225/dispanin family protein [Planctomycetota bacterium]